MAYTVPDLPYDYAALEPHIDEATMRVHHDKHHQAYVDKANAALEGTEWADKPIEEVLRTSTSSATRRRRCATTAAGTTTTRCSGRACRPDGGGEPDGALADAINSAFGSFADFQAKLKDAGVNQFGSGWSWLVHDGSGLAVVSSANQDNPISERPDAPARRRRVGARLLPEVPEPAPRLHRRLVEHRQLAEGRREVLRGCRALGSGAGRLHAPAKPVDQLAPSGRASRRSASDRRSGSSSRGRPSPACSRRRRRGRRSGRARRRSPAAACRTSAKRGVERALVAEVAWTPS